MSLADSLYNLQLVQEFCRNNLNHCCHFSLEDMLYAHASIKVRGRVFRCVKTKCMCGDVESAKLKKGKKGRRFGE